MTIDSLPDIPPAIAELYIRSEWLLRLLSSPLAMTSGGVQRLLGMRDAMATSDPFAGLRASAASYAGRRRALSRPTGTVAGIGLYGTILQRLSPIQGMLTGAFTSTIRFSAALREAVDDPDVDAIVIDIDSPGGGVFGVQELANEVFAARSRKPVYAVANSLAASAAYWIGSQATRLFVAPGGEVGSIGVFTVHEDISQALDMAGVKVSLISAGKYKVEGSPYEPLSASARAYAQAQVDDYYGAFTRDVARGRRVSVETVRTRMGEGRLLGASQALAAQMIDGTRTLQEVIDDAALAPPAKGQPASPKLALLRREIDLIGGDSDGPVLH